MKMSIACESGFFSEIRSLNRTLTGPIFVLAASIPSVIEHHLISCEVLSYLRAI